MIEQRVKKSKTRILKSLLRRYGEPLIAFALMISTLYTQVSLVKITYQNREILMREVIACSLVGFLY